MSKRRRGRKSSGRKSKRPLLDHPAGPKLSPANLAPSMPAMPIGKHLAMLDDSVRAALKALGPCPKLPWECITRDFAYMDGKYSEATSAEFAATKQKPECQHAHDEIRKWNRARRAILDSAGRGRIKVLGSSGDYFDATHREAGVEINSFGRDKGTRERAQREQGVHQAEIANTEKDSQPITVTRATDTLGAMLRARTIGRAHARAGRKFRTAFSLALLDRMATISLLRVGGTPTGGGSTRVDDARAEVGKAVAAMGGEASMTANIAWFVLGQGHSIRDWCQRQSLGHGRRINTMQASGLLIAALELLHNHYQSQSEKRSGR